MARSDKQMKSISSKFKSNKKDKSKEKSKTKEYNKRRNESSDDDDNDSYDEYDSEEEYESGDEMDEHEYRKFLKKIFPSKNMNEKIKAGERLKRQMKYEEDSEDEESESDDEEDVKPRHKRKTRENKKKSKVVSKKKSKSKRHVETDSDDDDEHEEADEELLRKKRKNQKKKTQKKERDDESETESEEEEEEDDDESETESEENDDDEIQKKSNGKFNIVFTIGGLDENEYDEDDDEDWEDVSDEYSTEDEDEPVSDTDLSESEDDEEEEDSSSEVEEEETNNKHKKSKTKKQVQKKENVKERNSKEKRTTKTRGIQIQTKKEETEIKPILYENGNEVEQVKLEVEEIPKQNTNTGTKDDFLSQLTELYKKNKTNPVAKECLKICEKKMKTDKKKAEKIVQKTKDKNYRIFRKMAHDKNTTNDYTFFSKLEVEHQKKIIKELREINKTTRIEKPYRMTLLESEMPLVFKGEAMKKINSLRQMEPGSGEYYKIKNWVDTFMRIPFGKYQHLPVNISDGIEKCHEFMENAKNTLDAAVYGMNDAKMQIMQLLGQLVTNPSAIGTAIAIHGPYGTGKTSIVKEGISKILNRPFAFIALGGATDSSHLEGHSYTYEGSTWGKIVQILIESKCMNPVIYFDELDKISDTPKGEEIAGILTHLTDTTQNSQFHDKYFAEVDFDLSKCLFIFSYNDESKVNPILLDRMYRIKTKGYDKKQKTIIGNQYLLPKIMQQVKFENGDIEIPEETLHYIIETHCNKEDGVRNMKRCLEIIYTKLNLYRLIKPDTKLFGDDMSLTVSFPFRVTKEIIDKLITRERTDDMALKGMYV